MNENEQLPHTGWCAIDPDHRGRCEPAPKSVTAAATAANVRRRLERNANELRELGWLVASPEELAERVENAARTKHGNCCAKRDSNA